MGKVVKATWAAATACGEVDCGGRRIAAIRFEFEPGTSCTPTTSRTAGGTKRSVYQGGTALAWTLPATGIGTLVIPKGSATDAGPVHFLVLTDSGTVTGDAYIYLE